MKLGKTANVRYGLGQPPALETNGIPMIRATNVKRGRIVREGLIFINPSAIPNSRNPFLRAGDILVVRSGAYTGDVALVTKEWEGAVAGYDLIVTPSDTIDSKFLTYYLLSSSVQKRHFVGLKVRSAQPHLNSSQVEETPIPILPLPEQQKIAEILSTVDERLELLRTRKEKLEKIKKGLMNDLLTGKVRVTSLISEEVTMREIEEIKNELRENMPILRDKYKVKTIGLFGSYIRGEQSRGSDVDILVEFYETIDLFTFIELEEFLGEKVGVKVDLVMKDTLKPRIKDNILREAVTL
jgi:predicted nucleotidyltransferase